MPPEIVSPGFYARMPVCATSLRAGRVHDLRRRGCLRAGRAVAAALVPALVHGLEVRVVVGAHVMPGFKLGLPVLRRREDGLALAHAVELGLLRSGRRRAVV